MTLDQRCRAIRLILSDVDGVLTDGGIVFDNQGIETKRFHVRDGMGIRLWQKAGYRFGLITHRSIDIEWNLLLYLPQKIIMCRF